MKNAVSAVLTTADSKATVPHINPPSKQEILSSWRWSCSLGTSSSTCSKYMAICSALVDSARYPTLSSIYSGYLIHFHVRVLRVSVVTKPPSRYPSLSSIYSGYLINFHVRVLRVSVVTKPPSLPASVSNIDGQ